MRFGWVSTVMGFAGMVGCTPGTETPAQISSPWSLRAHPCVGHRTDALWLDDAAHAFVGCGTTSEGFGLYATSDGGSTWSLVGGESGAFARFRVSSIARAADGVLYVAGTGDDGSRVRTVDSDGTIGLFYEKPASGAQSWQTFHVGTFRRDAAGRAVAESLTGSDVIYWPDTSPVNGYGWWSTAGIAAGAQILDLELHGDRFYGVGSTISQPPYFFYEAAAGMGSAFALGVVALPVASSGAIGEVWDLAVDSAGRFLAAGVDEEADTAVAWFASGDVTQASAWTRVDVHALTAGGTATRLYGACRDGDVLAVVGDYSQRAEALFALSTDGGATWAVESVPETATGLVGPLSRCAIVDGDVVVVGADGFFGKRALVAE